MTLVQPASQVTKQCNAKTPRRRTRYPRSEPPASITSGTHPACRTILPLAGWEGGSGSEHPRGFRRTGWGPTLEGPVLGFVRAAGGAVAAVARGRGAGPLWVTTCVARSAGGGRLCQGPAPAQDQRHHRHRKRSPSLPAAPRPRCGNDLGGCAPPIPHLSLQPQPSVKLTRPAGRPSPSSPSNLPPPPPPPGSQPLRAQARHSCPPGSCSHPQMGLPLLR